MAKNGGVRKAARCEKGGTEGKVAIFFKFRPAGPPHALSRTSAGPDRLARSAAAAALPVIGSTTKARKTRTVTFGATAGRSVVLSQAQGPHELALGQRQLLLPLQ